MGQISTRIYEKACVYDFSVNGGTTAIKNMGIAINGGETIVAIRYTVLIALATNAADPNIDAGFGFASGLNFVDVLHTVAVLNASIGQWKIPAYPSAFPYKIAVGSLSDTGIYFAPKGNVLTAGKMLFSFDIMSHPM